MYVIVRRTLKDYDAWKEIVSTNNEVRAEKGSRGVMVYRSAHNPNEVVLVFEWDDNKSYRDYFGLSDVQQTLSETGDTEVIAVSEAFHLDA